MNRTRTLFSPWLFIALFCFGPGAAAGCGGDDGAGNDNGNQNGNQNQNRVICGNGVVEGLEECDHGTLNSDSQPDACRTDCRLAHCGDRVVDTGEACDDGAANSDQVPDACRVGCHLPTCGDNVVDLGLGELCDDGNLVDGDGCSSSCQPEFCGNGRLDGEEVCDDGNTRSGDGCSADCASLEICPNGIVDVAAGEECDEGEENSDLPDAFCRTDCRMRRCGDGILDVGHGEDCEPGVPLAISCLDFGYYGGTLGCSTSCRFDTGTCQGTCGDGVVDAGREICDGESLGGRSCLDFGFDRGALGCTLDCRPRTDDCQRIGWIRHHTPTTRRLAAVWGSGPDAIYAVGDVGAAVRWDGLVWNPWNVPSSEDLVAITGTAADNLFLADLQGRVYRFNGTSWSDTAFPNLSDVVTELWGHPSGAVFASMMFSGEIHRWDGAQWSFFAQPTSGGLNALWGTGPDNLYAGGAGGEIARYDGASWSLMTTPVGAGDVSDIWGDGQGQVYAVGGDAFLWKRQGDAWVPHSLHPYISLPQAVRGDLGGHIYVADYYGRIAHYDPALELWSWADTAWDGVSAFWGDGAGALWGATYSGLMLKWSGASWTKVWEENIFASRFEDVWATSPEHLWAVGPMPYNLHRFDGLNWHWVSTGWSVDLFGVWVAGPNDLFLVGAQSLLLRHDGASATRIFVSGFSTLRGVWGTSPTDVHFVGDGGLIGHYGGAAATLVTTPTTERLDKVWGPEGSGPGGAVWAVGASGTVVHRPAGGGSWVVQASPTTAHLRDIAGSSASDLWAVGDSGAVIRYDGAAWTLAPSPGASDLRSLWVFGPRDVFVSGANGKLWHWNGQAWGPLSSGLTVELTSLWGQGEHLVVLGDLGRARRLLRERSWACEPVETNCCDGVDNDCDGLIDAADPDCAAILVEICDDGLDNDCDGLIDACDPDCAGIHVEICDDGLDNDCDGLIDACDPDCPTPPEDCTDGVDNDCDGDVDCADLDCATHPSCTTAGLCAPVVDLACNDSGLSGTTLGGPSRHGGYVCATGPTGGPEAYFRLSSPTSGIADVLILNLTGDVDLYILGHVPGQGCVDSGTCVIADRISSDLRWALFNVTAGETYYAVVDGPAGVTSSFEILFGCP